MGLGNRGLPGLGALSWAALAAAVLAALLTWGVLARVEPLGLTGQVRAPGQAGPLFSAVYSPPAFSYAQPFGRTPRPFELRLTGHLHAPQAGRYELALVSLRPARLSAGAGEAWAVPGLLEDPPPTWRVLAFPAGGEGNLMDRDPATRWSSGRAKQGDESVTVELGEQRMVLGVVLDSHLSERDCPLAFRVEASAQGQEWHHVAGAEVPDMWQPLVDAFFPPVAAGALRIRQLGRHPVNYWSIHELFVVDQRFLERRAHAATLAAGSNPIAISLRAEAEHPGEKKGYLLLRLFWRPPGGVWQETPHHLLSTRPQPGDQIEAARWSLALRPWLWWLDALVLVLLISALYRDWLWRESRGQGDASV